MTRHINKEAEYLIYETGGRYGMPRLTRIEANAYEKWAKANPEGAHMYPVVVRGLTYELSKKMVELTEEN